MLDQDELIEKKERCINIFNSELGDFRDVASELSERIEAESVIVVLKSANDVEFVLLQEANERFANRFGDLKWKQIINLEISMITRMILTKNESYLLDYAKDRDENFTEEKAEAINQKIEIVRKKIISKKLSQSFIIKSTSKSPIINQLDWEVNEKVFDDTEGNIENLRYATIQLRTSHPSTSDMFPFPLIFGPRDAHSEKFTITCDVSDIDYMMNTLQDIALALKEKR